MSCVRIPGLAPSMPERGRLRRDAGAARPARWPLLAAMLALLLPPVVRADFDVRDTTPERSLTRPRFTADAASWLGPDGPEVALGFQMPYRDLFFQPYGRRYRSELDLIMALYHGDEQIGGELFPERREVSSLEDARSATLMVRRILPLATGPGRFRAEVTAREARAGLENRAVWKINVPDYEHIPLSLSSLWVVARSDSTADSLTVPPAEWILHDRFGEPLDARCIVGEVYRPVSEQAPVSLAWKILGLRGDEIQRGELTVGPGRKIPFRIRPGFSSLWLGFYTFELRASCGEDHARRRLEFQIEESTASLDADLSQSLDLVGIIATSEEMQELKNSPPPERQEAWDRFWKRRDPTPETPENEFRDEFFRRVRYANDHFSVLGPGWRSDRGRTYILLGPPDEVESYPYSIDSPPYEIWIYTGLGRRIVFVDYEGFGRYEYYQPGRS